LQRDGGMVIAGLLQKKLEDRLNIIRKTDVLNKAWKFQKFRPQDYVLEICCCR
jgi:hypothetical protein